jgi:hypothetical protein
MDYAEYADKPVAEIVETIFASMWAATASTLLQRHAGAGVSEGNRGR